MNRTRNRRIADILGIRAASLYYYLPSKEAALAAVCELGVKNFIADLSEVVASSRDASQKLRAAIEIQLSPLRTRPYADYIRVFLRHRHQLPDGPRRHIVNLSREYQKLVQQIFADGVSTGEFRPNLNVEFAAFALLGLCNSNQRPWPPRPSDVEKLITQYSGILTNGVISERADQKSDIVRTGK